MESVFSRTQMMFGESGMEILKKAHVAVFGLGGVGGYAVEALARSGIGALDLIDSDTVSLSNLNRQILATLKTVGQLKTEAAAERIAQINPSCLVKSYPIFYLPETAEQFDFSQYDYIVDAIDTVTGKLDIIEHAFRAGVPVISSMGAGNKLDPTAFQVCDISRTAEDPLARVMRKELRKRGIDHLKVVYSREKPIRPYAEEGSSDSSAEESPTDSNDVSRGVTPKKRITPGSVSFVPSVAGLILAGEVIKDLVRFSSVVSE